MAADTPTPSSDPQRDTVIREWTIRRRMLERLRYAWAAVAIVLIGLLVVFDLLEQPAVVIGACFVVAILFSVVQARYSRCPACNEDPGPRVRFNAPKHVRAGASDTDRWENCARCGATLLDEATIAEFRARRFGKSGQK